MRVYFASAEPLTRDVLAILGRAKELSGVTEDFQFAEAHDRMPNDATVVAFGSYTAPGNQRVIPAPSVKQILTKADILTRLGQAFKMLVGTPELPKFEYVVLEELDETVRFLEGTRGYVLAADIEVSGDIKVDHVRDAKMLSMAFYGGQTAYVLSETVMVSEAVRSALRGFLDGNRLIGHNWKFDGKYVHCYCGTAGNLRLDTMLLSYALFPASGEHGLKPLAKRYLGADEWETESSKYTRGANFKEPGTGDDGVWWDARKYSAGSGFERIPRQILYKYNAFDVYYTYHLAKELEYLAMQDTDVQRVNDRLVQLSGMFMEIEQSGVHIDLDYLIGYGEELTVQGEVIESELHELAQTPLNPRSPMQVKAWFAEHGIRLKSTDAEALSVVQETGEPEIAAVASKILESRDNNKKLGTYVKGFISRAHDSVVYPTFKLHASTTGRLGATSPAVMTIPRDKKLRKLVDFPEGYLGWGPDYSQAELRVMACESEDQFLIDAFQPGAGDFFDLLLNQAYPQTNWEVLHKRIDAGEASPEEAGHYKEMRANMKGVCYGSAYGRGVPAIAKALEISEAEAQTLADGFVRPGSKFDQWRSSVVERAVKGEEIVTRFGRHFQSELVTPKNRHTVINSALSFVPQSTANDIALSAALKCHAWLPEYASWIVLTCHDQIVGVSPEGVAETVSKKVQFEMEQAAKEVYGDVVPFVAEWSVGKNWAEL